MEKKNFVLQKLCALTFALVIGFTISTSWATSYTYTFQPEPRADLWDLDHNYYYAWGINWEDRSEDPPTNEIIESATLEIKDIYNWKHEDNDVLHMWLVDELPEVYWNHEEWPGTSYGNDWQNPSDKFAGCGGTFLGDYTDDSDLIPEDLTVDIPVTPLTQYISNDSLFGIALDPDCHYYNNGLSLIIHTSTPIPPPPNVPEPVTMLGVLIGVSGLGGYLRKRRLASV